jgi:glutaredoxin-like protein
MDPMALLSASDQQTLRESLNGVVEPVTILFFTQVIDCAPCDETREILREITALTDRVTVEEVSLSLEQARATQYGIDRVPGLVVLVGDAKVDTRIRFLGAPEGWDFLALVDAILAVSGGSPQKLSAKTIERLEQLTSPLSLHVFVTATCPHCPRAVAIANRMAFQNPHITATTVQATEFYDLARKYRVSGVPKTVVSNGNEILGALPEAEFVDEVLSLPDTGAGRVVMP